MTAKTRTFSQKYGIERAGHCPDKKCPPMFHGMRGDGLKVLCQKGFGVPFTLYPDKCPALSGVSAPWTDTDTPL